MRYRIEYEKKVGSTRRAFTQRILRFLVENPAGWQLKDGNLKNIRTFSTVAEAMTWIDEERRGV